MCIYFQEPGLETEDEEYYEYLYNLEMGDSIDSEEHDYEDDREESTFTDAFLELLQEDVTANVIIYPGQKFKSYTALCRHMGQTAKGGYSKPHQIAEFNRFFTFHKTPSKNEVVIDEVFDLPRQKPMRKSNSKLKAAMNIIYYLAKQHGTETKYTYSKLATQIGLVTPVFLRCRSQPALMANDLGVPAEHITKIAQNVYSSLRDTLKSMLRRMVKEGYITCDPYTLARVVETSEDNKLLDHVREAKASEISLDARCSQAAIQAVGCIAMAEVFHKKQFLNFAKRKEALFDEYSKELPSDDPSYQLRYVFRAFSIVVLKDMDLSDFDISRTRDLLKDLFFERCLSHCVSPDIDETEKAFLLNCFILGNGLHKFDDFQTAADEIWNADNPYPNIASRIKAYCDKINAQRGA